MDKKITAPFTKDQVDALNKWQQAGYVHPFTCCSTNRSECPDEGQLIATEEGWVCPCGKYKQLWAHDFMFELPKHPFGNDKFEQL